MKTFYLLTGSVFSFVWLFTGVLLLTDKFDFGLERNTRIIFGSIICMYGLFRIYMFYRRLRSYRNNDENI